MNTQPDRLNAYFRDEWAVLLIVTASGLLYNLGLLADPWFEGRLAQCLCDVYGGSRRMQDMIKLCVFYVLAIAFVQGMRFIKRFYVRRFANHVNRSMKQALYGNLIQKGEAELEQEKTGNILAKSVADVDACAEGMRKAVTEIFDTGVALFAYAGMLLWYDWRLGALCMLFPPIACILAEKMKGLVERAGRAHRESAGRLNAAVLDLVAGAVTYRTFGCEKQRGQEYERCLADYEKRAVRSGVQASALQPLYQALAMTGAGFILWFGSQNVQGVGHAAWDIGMLTTFLACYAKLARKASHAAKLFNAVQKARVSWRRIRPFLKTPLKDLVLALETSKGEKTAKDIRGLEARRVSFSWNAEKPLFEELTFTAKPGQIVGVTGPVACGKPSLGQIFCGDVPYGGSIRLNGREPREMKPKELHSLAVWQGHDSMLLADSIRENVQMGEEKDVWPWLKAVCMDREVAEMENGADTAVGSGGIRLSGGQQERLALARTLAHGKEVIVLDDPFASLDRMTEEQVFANVRELSADRIVLLISHRLYLFPQLDQVIWMADGRTAAGSHEELMKKEAGYAALYRMQMEGGAPDEA